MKKGMASMKGNVTELNYDSFFDMIEGSKTFTIVEFYTETCPNCRAAAPIYERIAAELGTYGRFARIDARRHPLLTQRYGIMSVPTFKFFCRRGPIGEIVGAINETVLKNTIKDFMKNRVQCSSSMTVLGHEIDGYA